MVRARVRFEIGVNFPWVTCGHDFGPRPPPWAGAPATSWPDVQRELEALREDGITIVRWWVLAGGVNVPCGAHIASIGERVPLFPRSRQPFLFRRPFAWRANKTVPPLPDGFVDDFERLLEACAAADVQLWPSWTSFELFLPLEDQVGGVTSGGRADFALGTNGAAFLDATLEPMLTVSKRHRGAIRAWEVTNEPGWALEPGFVKRFGRHRPFVHADALNRFLEDAIDRIVGSDFVASVGFLHAEPEWWSAALRGKLAALAAAGKYVHQLHHYPSVTKVRRLPPASASPIAPCIVGEVSTSQHGRWNDPGLSEDDSTTFVERRLSLIADSGYAGALLWAHRATDPHTRWDAETRAQVRRAARRLEARYTAQ